MRPLNLFSSHNCFNTTFLYFRGFGEGDSFVWASKPNGRKVVVTSCPLIWAWGKGWFSNLYISSLFLNLVWSRHHLLYLEVSLLSEMSAVLQGDSGHSQTRNFRKNSSQSFSKGSLDCSPGPDGLNEFGEKTEDVNAIAKSSLLIFPI